MSLIELGYKYWVRPMVFANSQIDPETAHEWAIEHLQQMQYSPWLLSWARKRLMFEHPMLKTRVFGLEFPNPLGLAAGFDKYCQIYHTAVPACGWGFAEVGGITRNEQPGNPRPRMWRSKELQALCNFMGFNNPGADKAFYVMSRNPKSSIPIGLNVGKSKDTPIENAVDDYCYTITRLWQFVDFITLNPSSPNTPGLRSLQNKSNLLALVRAAQAGNRNEAKLRGVRPKPLGIKISPDESDEQLQDIVDVVRETLVDFLILTNTTTSRKHTQGWAIPADRGGVSGRPLSHEALRVQRQVYRLLDGKVPIIGVGGIFNAHDLFVRIINGASLCQVYTAWPFEGPDFVRRCLNGLVEGLENYGLKSVQEAVGAAL